MADSSKPRRHKRRQTGRRFPPRSKAERQADRLWIYGVHAVAAALANPERKVLRLLATENARRRLELGRAPAIAIEPATPKELDRLLGEEAVHQGIAVEVEPLASPGLDALAADARLLLFLDQVTDPHNVGAILRTAAAMAADAVIVTARHSPAETGVLAKSASGALDLIPLIVVPNLARALETVGDAGFERIGLDSDAPELLEDVFSADRLALVVGAEGKGLRQRTRLTCNRLARLDLPGELRSLNVSNAAALALYSAGRFLAMRHRRSAP
jgi:23S rRNA (guanosine2251-2'-O)-methyltransferase